MAKQRPYISALWHAVPSNIHARLEESIQRGIEGFHASPQQASASPKIFFRADDIAIPSPQCTAMMRIFAEHNTPLALATVPAWSTPSHIETLLSVAPTSNNLWCWHQHGWSHISHALQGKKCEFGNNRPAQECFEELQQGTDTLFSLLGDALQPVFTPPWNRMGEDSIQAAKDLGFKAISRSESAPKQNILPDIPVNVDLHTRSELTAESGWNALLEELRAGIASGQCGVMLHHERINPAAELFLQRLLIILQSYPVQPVPLYPYML